MSIDARVAYVEVFENGNGILHLCDRTEGSRGQSMLRFKEAPFEVTALNGLEVWGGDSSLMLCETEIAQRDGYTKIVFVGREQFLAAVAQWHARQRGQGK